MSEERDVMEFDLLVVGAGPAGRSCAIHAKQLNPELNVCVLEKGATVGSHILAGAVIEPGPLEELLPNWKDNAPEVCVPVSRDEIRMMSAQGSFKFPIVPPQMNNHGNYIVSLSSLTQKMAEAAEELGVEIYPGFPARMPLYNEAGEVIGVRTGDMGVDKDGNPKDGYTPGMDLHAKLTVFAEGARGSCSKQLVAKYGLDAQADPQTYGIGIKELWQLPPGRTEPGLVMHTMGWPLDNKTYGGSFVYHLEDDKLAIGFVVGLDYEDPHLEPFEKFQEFKNHPHIKPLLEGGEIVSYGARAIVEGGWQSLPKMEMPGAALIGCGAGTLNVPKIKGVHQAIRSGMEIAKQFHEKASAEGFDAPRLRVIAYLTTVVTKSRFLQGITRAVRMTPELAAQEPTPRHPSYVYAPADPLLMGYARTWSLAEPYVIQPKQEQLVEVPSGGSWRGPSLPLEAVDDGASQLIRVRSPQLPGFLRQA